jgi:O-methyltransferase
MIGAVGLRNIRWVLETVIRDNVPGDFLEAGVWRGGASIFARAVLDSYEEGGRRVWV